MRYEEGSYEGEVNEAKNPEGQVGYNRLYSKLNLPVSARKLNGAVCLTFL